MIMRQKYNRAAVCAQEPLALVKNVGQALSLVVSIQVLDGFQAVFCLFNGFELFFALVFLLKIAGFRFTGFLLLVLFPMFHGEKEIEGLLDKVWMMWTSAGASGCACL